MDTLAVTIDTFIKTVCPSRKRKTAGNLLKGYFLEDTTVRSIQDELLDKRMTEAIEGGIKQAVASYTRDKATAISIFRDFVTFLQKNMELPWI